MGRDQVMDAEYTATSRDDEFHVLDATEWWMVETVWFAFTIPERRMNGVVYLVCRPSMGVCALHVNVFDDTGHAPQSQRYWRSLWQLPLPKSLVRFDMAPVGLKFEVLEPLTRYRVQYEDGPEIAVDFTWSALVPPRMAGPDHIDQFGRVEGRLVLNGETIPIDCLQMRDRSWKRRSDLEGRVGGYTYGLASKDLAFLVGSSGVEETKAAGGGWILRDGQMHDVVGGERRILARGDAGEPLRLALSLQDRAGRTLEAEGDCVARAEMNVSGNIFAWDSLVQWRFDGQTCWGEDQDVWTPAAWRASPHGARRSRG